MNRNKGILNTVTMAAAMVLVALSVTANTCFAEGKDDFVVLSTRDFIEICGLQDKGYGHQAILTKEYANSSDGQDLIMRFVNCQMAYENGNPAAAPGKPEGILEALRRHSLGQTPYGGVKFPDEKTGERFPLFCITNSSGKIALLDGKLHQITDYKFDEWAYMDPYWVGVAVGEKDMHIDIRTIQTVPGTF